MVRAPTDQAVMERIRKILKRWGGMSRQGEAFVTDGGQHFWRHGTGDLTAAPRPPLSAVRQSLSSEPIMAVLALDGVDTFKLMVCFLARAAS
jgi:hypothetical protein